MNTPAEQWNFIRTVLREYYERNRDNAEVNAYAHQIHQLAERCYMQREEAGGWAGEFVRTLLMLAARDTAAREEHWDDPPDAWWRTACEWVLGDLCGTMQAGFEHFDEHLAPGFYEYIKTRLFRVGTEAGPDGAFEAIRADMKAIIEEHDNLIELAVRPAAQSVHEYGAPWFRSMVALNIAGDAVQLRKRTLDRIRLDLAEAGLITRSQGVQLLSTFTTIPMGF